MDDAFYELEACHYYRKPPSSDEVARRAMALGALWLRSQLEVETVLEESRSWAQAEAERTVFVGWLRASGVYGELTLEELPIVEAPVGALSHDATVDSSWRVEAVVPLLWALGWLEEMPPFDEEVHAEDLMEMLPLSPECGGEECREFLADSSLVAMDDIRRQREVAELWHHRASTATFECEEDRQRLFSIAFERLYALNWLSGMGRCWDETPVDRAS